jgi:hypothetical protein
MSTLKEAEKETGVTRAAIYKAIQSGRLNASKDDNGALQVDLAEIRNIYKVVDKVDVKLLFRW